MFNWLRLKSTNRPMPAVGVNERPSTRMMGMLVDMYTDEEIVTRYAERIREKMQYVINGGGEQYQEYEQKDLSVFAGEDYYGTTKIGRAYSKSLLPYLPSKILNTIYQETHLDLDIRCSYSTMLLKAFGDLDLDFFPAYVADPDSFYGSMGIPKWRAKKLVNMVICSAPNVSENPEIGNWAELSRNDTVVRLKSDVDKMCKAVRERYPDFYRMIETKCKAENKSHHIDGTALSYLAADMEHSVMRKAIKYVFPEDTVLPNVVWKFDGILIPKTALVGVRHDQFLSEMEDHILASTGIRVVFRLGSLGESFGICLGQAEMHGEAEDPYLRWKRHFEKKYARLDDPPVFMMFTRGGDKWVDLNKTQFEHNTMEQPKEFMKRWLDDPEKRRYKTREFCPPPVEMEDGCYNLFRGFAAADLLPNEGEVDISLYLNHVHLLCGKVQENTDYLHKLLAQKFQKPGLKWRVMPIIVSAQGVGKDIWFDFLWAIFGKGICVKDNGIHKFADSNSHVLEGKLLVCLQEMGYKDIKDYEEDLKAMITNETLIVKKKYFNSFAIRNSFDIIGFTNQVGAVNVPPDDRRFFILESDSTYAQDKDYMMPLLAFFHSTENQRAVYDYYMNMDIAGFDSSADRPITEAHKEMSATCAPFGDRFFKVSLSNWIAKTGVDQGFSFLNGGSILRVSSSAMLDDFCEFARTNQIRGHESRHAMTAFLARQIRELNLRTDKYKTGGRAHLIDKYRTKHCRFNDIDVRGLKAYLTYTFNEEDGEEDMAVDAPAPRRTLHRSGPGDVTRFVIRENGEVVFGTDDLEEANKELGEAYVTTRWDDVENVHVQFLVHQHRNNMEIPLGREYMGDNGKARLEAKYPFYVRDRSL